MAIAGILLSVPEAETAALETALRGREGILETRRTPDEGNVTGLAVVMEQPSGNLQAELKALRDMPGVADLHLAFADYEDDMDGQGHMACPPHESRHSGGAASPCAPGPDGDGE